MAQNGLVKSHSIQTSGSRSKSFNPYISSYMDYQIHGNYDARNKKLSLNQYEKAVLSIGGMLILGMMFLLVSLKITVGGYQERIMRSNVRISRIRNTTNGLHQDISDLQRNGRLKEIAHENNLRLSDKNVRNVK